MQLHLDAFVLEDRLDQLVEAARDDHDAVAALTCSLDEFAKPAPDVDVLELPADDLLERLPHRLELAGNHLAERHPPLVEAVVDLLVDDRVSERRRDRVEEVFLRNGAVEVDDQSSA